MLSEERIKVMNDLALFEEEKGKEQIKIAGYYRKDYVGIKMITTALWVVLGYVLLAGLVVVVQFESLLAKLSLENLMRWGIMAVVLFVILLVVYLVIAHRYFSAQHRKAVREVKEYYGKLRRLDRLYKQEVKNRSLDRTLVDWEETDR